MNPQNERNLERLAERALRDLPLRRAPSSLEARVQAELARRHALPWWRKSYSYWPAPARIAFTVVAIAMVGGGLLGLLWVQAGIDGTAIRTAFAPQIEGWHAFQSFCFAAVNLVSAILGSMPTLWLYTGIATVVSLYVALFGLGAAAYRTLYAPSH